MAPKDDLNAYRSWLEAKLDPKRIRSTLAFAGLFQLTHEAIKYEVLERVKAFYGFTQEGDGRGQWLGGPPAEQQYQQDVLALAPKNPFRASLEWLRQEAAITDEQVARLASIYSHRHELTHELGKYIIDPDCEPDVDLFEGAVEILKAITRFWAQVQIDVGTYDGHDDIDVDDVTPAYLLFLQLCLDAFADGWRADFGS